MNLVNVTLAANQAARLFEDEDMSLEDIATRMSIDQGYVSALINNHQGTTPACERCSDVLSYRRARRLGGHLFCEGCRSALFEMPFESACQEYPDLFEAEESK